MGKKKIDFDLSEFVSRLMNYLPIALLALGVYLVYLLFTKGLFGFSLSGLFGNKTTADKEQNVSGLSKAGILANNLYDAMDRWGYDETVFSSVYESLKNDFSLTRAVFKAFGVKKYFMGYRSGILGDDLNLYGWLSRELSSSDLSKWTNLFRSADLI